ncbi:hypothetical protein [Streptomyces yangpuensis]
MSQGRAESRRVREVGAPYAENSNDSACLVHADRPLTGYERVWGDVAAPR